MRQVASVLMLSLLLAGCVTTGPYGNFVEEPESLDQQKIASDTVRQLARLYPPAKTRLELQHLAADPFGEAFVRDLRDSGYALLEFDPRSEGDGGSDMADTMHAQGTTASFPLSYVLAQTIDTNLYHVTVIVGHQSITRAYAGGGGSAAPAGYWVRKE